MSADAVQARLLGSRTTDDSSRVREVFFLVLMAVLFLSVINIYVDRENLKYYKYLCWMTFGAMLVIAGFVCCVRQPPTAGTAIAIIFGFIGYITVGLAQLSTGSSFGSALIPFAVTTLGYLTMGKGRREVERYVALTYVACGIILIAAIIAPRDNFFRINEFSFVLVFGLVFALVLRNRLAAVSILIVIVITLVLRPSSTLFVGVAMGVALAMGFGSRPKSAQIVSCIIIVAFAIMALVAMSDPDLAFVVGDIESYVKETILGGESQSTARAALIVSIQENFSRGSFLFGNYFKPEGNSDVSDILGRDDFTAPVHSDFVQMLYRGGIVSLIAFCYFLGEVTFLHRKRKKSPESDFLRRTVPTCTAVFAFYISFNPIMLNIEYSLWFFMLSFICLGLTPDNQSCGANS
jgi:hypothetical protein